MRILHVYPKSDFFTGAAVQLFELARELARRGHHIVLVTRPSRLWAERSSALGITHYEVPMTSEIDVRSAV